MSVSVAHSDPRIFTGTIALLTGALAGAYASGAGASGTFKTGPVLIIVACVLSTVSTVRPGRRFLDMGACAAFVAAWLAQAVSLADAIHRANRPWFGPGGGAVGVLLFLMFAIVGLFAWAPLLYYGTVVRRANGAHE